MIGKKLYVMVVMELTLCNILKLQKDSYSIFNFDTSFFIKGILFLK